MALQLGNNSLGPRMSAGYTFNRPVSKGLFPCISVIPTSPSFTPVGFVVSSDGYPVMNQLGASTQWSQLSDDESQLSYFIVVENNSNNTVEFSFVFGEL
jgi:hypothetical protein